MDSLLLFLSSQRIAEKHFGILASLWVSIISNCLLFISRDKSSPFPVHPSFFDLTPFVKYIMLHHKYNIEQDRYVAQTQFYRIARYPGPIALQTRINHELCNGQNTANKVQQDLIDAPASGRLPLVVCPGLGDIFYHSDDQLDITNCIDLEYLWSANRASSSHSEMTSEQRPQIPRILTTSIQAHEYALLPSSRPFFFTMPTTHTTPMTQPTMIPHTPFPSLTFLFSNLHKEGQN